ncbi:hypothetical protein EGW08_015994 [Elysia chlorotica]|uniref:Uncharacterized protein n=1 Tax=Elysia chlorotica TaxID=188477 RepID=A0A433T3Z6_ELYCH|nr:hypothetical protein EGW08_015994 [Elysia chlorotica]
MQSARNNQRIYVSTNKNTGSPLEIKTSVDRKADIQSLKMIKQRSSPPQATDQDRLKEPQRIPNNSTLTKSHSKSAQRLNAAPKTLPIQAALLGLCAVMTAVILVSLLRYIIKRRVASRHCQEFYQESALSPKPRLKRGLHPRNRKHFYDRMWFWSMSTIIEHEDENLVEQTHSSRSDCSEGRHVRTSRSGGLDSGHAHSSRSEDAESQDTHSDDHQPTLGSQYLCEGDAEHRSAVSSPTPSANDPADGGNSCRGCTQAAHGEQMLDIRPTGHEHRVSRQLPDEPSGISDNKEATPAQCLKPSSLSLSPTNHECSNPSASQYSMPSESTDQEQPAHESPTGVPSSGHAHVESQSPCETVLHASRLTAGESSLAPMLGFDSDPEPQACTPLNSLLETSLETHSQAHPQTVFFSRHSSGQRRRRHHERSRVHNHLFRRSHRAAQQHASESNFPDGANHAERFLPNHGSAERPLTLPVCDFGAMVPLHTLPTGFSMFLARQGQPPPTEPPASTPESESPETTCAVSPGASEDVHPGNVLVQQLSNGAQLIYIPAPPLPEYVAGEDNPPPYHQ